MDNILSELHWLLKNDFLLIFFFYKKSLLLFTGYLAQIALHVVITITTDARVSTFIFFHDFNFSCGW
jgi:hypothetical protein